MVNKKLLLATRKDDSYVIDITTGEISAIEHGYDCDKNIGSICPTPFNTMTSEGYNVFDLRYFYLERNDRYWKAIKIMFNGFVESPNEIPHLYVAIKDQEGNYLQTPTSIGGYKEKAYFSNYVGYNKYLDAVTKLRVYLGPSDTPPTSEKNSTISECLLKEGAVNAWERTFADWECKTSRYSAPTERGKRGICTRKVQRRDKEGFSRQHGHSKRQGSVCGRLVSMEAFKHAQRRGSLVHHRHLSGRNVCVCGGWNKLTSQEALYA